MLRVRTFLASRLPPKVKQQILGLRERLKLQNLIFVVTIGAVNNDFIKPQTTQFQVPNNKSVEILKNLEAAIEQANRKLFWPVRPTLRFIDGMSGQSFRLVLNKLAVNLDNYLEVGTWRGSTACAVLDRNHVSAWLVDDWSEFGGPSSSALKNLSKFLGSKSRLNVISEDFRRVDFDSAIDSDIDFYLFDGPHSQTDHIEGATVINSLKFNSLLFVVDDWNWEDVRTGTLEGLRRVSAEVIYKVEIFSNSKRRFQFSRWHNGYCFFILERI